jgi:hypothetical protein
VGNTYKTGISIVDDFDHRVVTSTVTCISIIMRYTSTTVGRHAIRKMCWHKGFMVDESKEFIEKWVSCVVAASKQK